LKAMWQTQHKGCISSSSKGSSRSSKGSSRHKRKHSSRAPSSPGPVQPCALQASDVDAVCITKAHRKS
jgi:hypothetical protein